MNPFDNPPGMGWVMPKPMEQLAVSTMPDGDVTKLAASMARERLHTLQGDKVEAEIDRIRRLTDADVTTRRIGHVAQADELFHLRQKYPRLISKLEEEIETNRAQRGTYEARTAQIGQETADDKARAAAELEHLEKANPLLIEKLESEIEQGRDESQAAREATEALTRLRDAQTDRVFYGTPHEDMAGAKLDTEQARAALLRAQTGAYGAGGTKGATNPLDPYSTAANRWNDDLAALAKDLYGPNVLNDVVTGEPMLGFAKPGEESREEKMLTLMRTARNIGQLAASSGQPMSPREAIDSAVQMLRQGGAPAAGGLPGMGAPGGPSPGGDDPLGLFPLLVPEGP